MPIVVPTLLALIAIHEIGHAVAGLILGMKLQGFSIGPFQRRIRDGKWAFDFKLKDSFSGTTSVVPASADFPLGGYLYVLFAGCLFNLVSGSAALVIVRMSNGTSLVQLGGALAHFGALSLLLGLGNLVPIRTGNSYSDGAQIFQVLSGGPWTDYRRADLIADSSLVAPLRPRDFDIALIRRAAAGIPRGKQGLHLRLYAIILIVEGMQTLRNR